MMPGDGLSIRGFSLTIACTDQDRSDHFYREILGATRDPRDGYGCPWYLLGGLRLSLMQNAQERSPASFPDHAMPILWLDVDDIVAAAARFARYEVEISQPCDGMCMMIADPDGLVIEVWQREIQDNS
jgi:catechol 2,3-dioxygenase-like lactoylglutathione lyase family enzyme